MREHAYIHRHGSRHACIVPPSPVHSPPPTAHTARVPTQPAYPPYKDEGDAEEEADDPGGALPPGEEADGALHPDDEDQPRQEEEVACLGLGWSWVGRWGLVVGLYGH